MEISIRNSIKNNFKDSSINEIRESIDSSVNDSEELALPGLGVFFEILWKNSNEEEKAQITKKIKEFV